MLTQPTKQAVSTLWEYQIVMQSSELDDMGVPEDTQEWISEFEQPQNKRSLSHYYDGWINKAGYHLVGYDLRRVKAKFEGDQFYRPVWQAGWVGDDDEF